MPMQMKAIAYTEHGPADVLTLTDLEVPAPKDHQVLVRVRAASVNPLDWHMMRGEPYDLLFINDLIDAGTLTPVIDRAYPLADAAEAIRYLEAGHARGKVVVVV